MGDIANNLRRRRHMTSRAGYIHFKDPEVARICIANFSSDGIGVTYDDAAAVTNWDRNWFADNSLIETFDELEYFTNLRFPIQMNGHKNPFQNCTNLRSISIPEGQNIIYTHCFYNCQNLTDIYFPSTMRTFSGRAFDGCSNLQNIHIKDLNSWLQVNEDGSWQSSVYAGYTSQIHLYLNGVEISGEVIIPEGITSIGNIAFTKCTSITSVVFPNSLINIGNNMNTTAVGPFYGCTGLTSISFTSNITYLGVAAFRGCTGLTALTLTNNITCVDNGAFMGCSGLNGQLIIPNSITKIGNNAFEGCSGLTGTLRIPSNISTLGSSAFWNCAGFTGLEFEQNSTLTQINSAFYRCTGMTGTLIVPNTVTSIIGGSCGAFGQTNFTGTLSVPNVTGVFQIGSMANITRLVVPEGVTEFYGLINGNSGYLDLPSTLTKITTDVYGNVAKTVVFRATSIPTNLSRFLNSYVSNTDIFYVPYSADHSILNNYKNAVAARLQSCFNELNPDGTIPATT